MDRFTGRFARWNAIPWMILCSLACNPDSPEGGERSEATTDELSECEKPTPAEPEATSLALTETENLTTYDDNIKALVQTHCLRCHPSEENTPEIDTYMKLRADNFRLARKMVTNVTLGKMPKDNPLPISVRSVFQKWSRDGFLETKHDEPVDPAIFGLPEKVTYDEHIGELIADNCLRCHGEGQQEPDISTYEKLAADTFALALSAVEEVEEGDMPRLFTLEERTKLIFKAWRDGGFLKDESSAPHIMESAPGTADAVKTTPASSADQDPCK